MKRFVLLSLIAVIFASCTSTNHGELVGVRKNSKSFYQPDPYGMVFVPMGSYTMGVGDQDISSSYTATARTISVSSFYMDETEITNNEYREFVYYVRDSILRRLLSEVDEELLIKDEQNGDLEDGDELYPLNWKKKIDWRSEDEGYREKLEEMYIPRPERFYGRKEIDARKLMYKYFWIDLHAAARKDFREGADYRNASFADRPQGMTDRSLYIHDETVNVYPDTLSWIHDYSYSFNDPLTETYFWHPSYDHYPVVGVNWNQARAFCVWRTNKLRSFNMRQRNGIIPAEFRLPTEAEWEWAARGGNNLNPYPWGGPYTRNSRGCLLANFKPLRGNYAADGGNTTVIVGHYKPNDWGLYDMAGNVAEWTSSAYDPLSYNVTWDMNPEYVYNAEADEDPIMKRKVIRGGSWKDIAHFIKVNTRTYEYQDTAKCYIGFRCVQSYLGRMKGDDPRKMSRVY